MSEKTFNNVKITSSFDIPEAKENLVSGETIGKHFGKIAKHMEDESIHHTVDDKLSDTSTNPVQNKAIKAELDKKADKTDIPSSLPANGGNADTVNGRAGWRVPTLTSSGALWDASAPNINDACIQWDESNQYFKIKTLGGNNIAVDFADTIDGKHASEFAVSLTNLQFGSNRIAIPDSVNVGEWLVENAKSGNQYFISTRGSRTNLPDVSADWMWFSYDGNRYYARAWIGGTDTRDFVLNYVNSVGGWKEIYTSDNKPYVTGTFTVNVSDTEQTINVPLTFDPSAVFLFYRTNTVTIPMQTILTALNNTEYKIKIGVLNSNDLSTLSTGFGAIIKSWKGTTSAIEYIAYK